MAKKENIKDLSTEEKIINAATKIFTEKGFAGARTRDIAAEAGINLALLNYYFRSKEKLFQEIMRRNVDELINFMMPILGNEKATLDEKIVKFVTKYIDVVVKNPNLPLFLLSEINKKNFQVVSVPFDKILNDFNIIKQIKERNPKLNPYHFFINLLALTIFPFLARPVFLGFNLADSKTYNELIEERKKLIPIWIKTLLDK